VVGGFNQPLSKMMEFVNWDDDIPTYIYIYIYYGKTKFMFQTTNQISKKILKSIGQERLSTFTSRGIESSVR